MSFSHKENSLCIFKDRENEIYKFLEKNNPSWNFVTYNGLDKGVLTDYLKIFKPDYIVWIMNSPYHSFYESLNGYSNMVKAASEMRIPKMEVVWSSDDDKNRSLSQLNESLVKVSNETSFTEITSYIIDPETTL